MSNIVKYFLQRNLSLTVTGLIHLFLIPIIILFSTFDNRMVTGVNVWIKPLKFAISISIFSFTIAWFMGDLPASFGEKKKKWLSGILCFLLILEMGIIALQAARGVGSHFNVDSIFDSILFSLMGIGINILTGVSLWIFSGFFRKDIDLSKLYLFGIRMGIICFVISCISGYIMIARNGHSVGVSEDAVGLVFLNWKLYGGDLRISHFIGMHSIQILPILGIFSDKVSNIGYKLIFYTFSFIYLFISGLTIFLAIFGIGFNVFT